MSKEIEKIRKHRNWFKEAMTSPNWREYVDDIDFLLSEVERLENIRSEERQFRAKAVLEIAEKMRRIADLGVQLEFCQKRRDEWQGKYLDLGEINQGLRNEVFELKQQMKKAHIV